MGKASLGMLAGWTVGRLSVCAVQCTETEATNAYVELGLRKAMQSITPRSKGNKHFLADIQNNLDLLKQHLVY